MNRTELATTLQFAFNHYSDPREFSEFLSRKLPERIDDLKIEQQLQFGEIRRWISSNDAEKTRQFALLLLRDIPRSPSAERTNLKLNWVVAVCAVLGLVLTAVPPNKVFASQDSQAAKATSSASPAPQSQPQKNETAHEIPSQMRILHSIQLGVILILAYLQGQWLGIAGSRIKPSMLIAAGTLTQFRRGWSALWWSWAVLYAWFTYAAVAVGKETTVILAIGDVVNSVTGIALWWCFLALDLPSVSIPGDEHRDRGFRTAVSIAVAAGVLCAVAGCADRFFNIGHFGVIMVGAFNGLGLACLAGRFTSHWMSVPRLQILFIYTYAMLQLIYPFFDLLGDRWEMGVYVFVLILKVMLANTLRSMVDDGGLDNYLEAAQAGKLGFLQSAAAVVG